MIAPLRETQDKNEDTATALAHARRAVASLLFNTDAPEPTVESVPAWKAWMLVGWLILVTIAFLWFAGSWGKVPVY